MDPIEPRKGGRPKGSFKNPEGEIAKEKQAWLSRLRKSGSLIDKLLEAFKVDLDNCELSHDTRSEIMTSLRDCIGVQVKVIAECQRMQDKIPTDHSSKGELDLS